MGHRTDQNKGDLALLKVKIDDPPPALELGGLDDIGVGSWVGSVGHGMGDLELYHGHGLEHLFAERRGDVFPDPDPGQSRCFWRPGL